MFTEDGDCSLLGDRSLANRNINMSFLNLEKRPRRPLMKDYKTVDIYGSSSCVFMTLVLWIKIIWRQRRDMRKSFITKIRKSTWESVELLRTHTKPFQMVALLFKSKLLSSY